jgi:Co/Zn/Cd efflux system component
MKFVNTIIYVLYLIVYAYAAWKISVKPEETYWGFLCVAIFGFLFTWTVSLVVKNDKKNKNTE